MASSKDGSARERAKGAIVTRQEKDPELEEALKSAHQFQLDLARENNRHTEAMRGWFPRVFGVDGNVASYIATVCMILSLGAAIFCLYVASKDAASAAIWFQQSERVFAFSASCLAYIFGRGFNKGR